ncbi:hypothetical protein B0H21DRAFT_711429 [Amylocystis lapponica]|nr:hypothetical protein B0H21DRAFT_711429 [Amylocystis lapponica]
MVFASHDCAGGQAQCHADASQDSKAKLYSHHSSTPSKIVATSINWWGPNLKFTFENHLSPRGCGSPGSSMFTWAWPHGWTSTRISDEMHISGWISSSQPLSQSRVAPQSVPDVSPDSGTPEPRPPPTPALSLKDTGSRQIQASSSCLHTNTANRMTTGTPFETPCFYATDEEAYIKVSSTRNTPFTDTSVQYDQHSSSHD